MSDIFRIETPSHDPATGIARFSYVLGDLHFTETLQFPPGGDADAAASDAFSKLLDLTAVVLGVSYFKLTAPLRIAMDFPLTRPGRDFALDLLFFHRGLNCLVAIELKVGRFEPEYLGKLAFYAEALDRHVRKPHENPAIGVLMCASKDDEVVEYALSRTASPALIAEYQTQLPDKALLQAKLHEFWLAGERTEDAGNEDGGSVVRG